MEILIRDSLKAGAEVAASVVKKIINSKENPVSMAAVGAPGFAAETKTVKMGSDSGQLVFVPDEVKICKGDSITWVNNKGGPHNVVFVEDAIPSGVSAESISMDDQLGDEGDVYTKKFDTPGSYEYYCEPHAGGGMKAVLIVA